MVAPALWPCNTWEVTAHVLDPTGVLRTLILVLEPQPSGSYTVVVSTVNLYPPGFPAPPYPVLTVLKPISDPTASTPFLVSDAHANALEIGMWLGVNLHYKNGYFACGLQLAKFWDAKNGVVSSTGIQYPIGCTFLYQGRTWNGAEYAPPSAIYPGTWNGLGFQPWPGNPNTPPLPFVMNGSMSGGPPLIVRVGGSGAGGIPLGSSLFPACPYGMFQFFSPTNDDIVWVGSILQAPDPFPVWNGSGWAYYLDPGKYQAGGFGSFLDTALPPTGLGTVAGYGESNVPPLPPPISTVELTQPTGLYFVPQNYANVPLYVSRLGMDLGYGYALNYLGARWLTPDSTP